ncbi:MAG: arsenite methyltransferase [Gemmatimonadales bacterium]|nr:arsenite methyltransferase [Gemmatimonadales bacterium]NIN50022.1 arsenite methyltransferase [Gemmatimonadales bacterium]NIP07486.1 arsenite methyltransferase [Gemmatimonadales bacterium]NIR03125.1 arsenite methyltransferase [Gemmatimonadales bacterium]NIS66837.1 arsenite methyltransferase [Gemmatimonadales bacterium]
MKKELKQVVRERYADAARRASEGKLVDCSPDCCSPEEHALPIIANLYEDAEVADLPQEAVNASLGCGNPAALAELHPGEVVLDLGSGGGIDVLLSAKRVGSTGKAYGLDMTDEMLELARENQRKSGVDNVEFLKGDIEDVPLPDSSVDVIISNCVINLAADKDLVFQEAFRVLKPGGRFAVSDIVACTSISPEVRENLELWSACVSGALDEDSYRGKLEAAGFQGVDLEPTRVFTIEGAGQFMGAFVRARKP